MKSKLLVALLYLLSVSAYSDDIINQSTSVSPNLINQADLIIIGNVTTNTNDLLKTSNNKSNGKVLLNVRKILLVKGECADGIVVDISLVDIENNDPYRGISSLIGLSMFHSDLPLLLLLKKDNGYYKLMNSTSWMFSPIEVSSIKDNINNSQLDMVNILTNSLNSINIFKFSNSIKQSIKNIPSELKIDALRIPAISNTFLNLSKIQILVAKRNFEFDINDDLASFLKDEMTNNSLPMSSLLYNYHAGTNEFRSLTNILVDNAISTENRHAVEKITSEMIPSLPEKYIIDNIINISDLHSDAIISACFNKIANYKFAAPSINTYTALYINTDNSLIKYFIYRNIIKFYSENKKILPYAPNYPTINEFKNNPNIYIKKWDDLLQKMGHSTTLDKMQSNSP